MIVDNKNYHFMEY